MSADRAATELLRGCHMRLRVREGSQPVIDEVPHAARIKNRGGERGGCLCHRILHNDRTGRAPTHAAPGARVACEQKIDGHRALLFTPSGPAGRVLLQTRRGALVQDRWPDLVAAAEQQLPDGLVLDGELVVWDFAVGALSFTALQRRAGARTRSDPALAARWPAYYVAFQVRSSTARSCCAGPTSSAAPFWGRCSSTMPRRLRGRSCR
ncbi:hypothetical protein [Streptomyces sp. WAC06614]|uniref:ATP-dependent DNA ligase n=1 Tax=Streptomyces sp. WAC06614 TaxID=2487416 RepID=UPI0021AE60BA|nr:hypothetical protein [Streptomyces sp. WAC06614]